MTTYTLVCCGAADQAHHPDSSRGVCEKCHRPLWIGPVAQQFLAAHTAAILCDDCGGNDSHGAIDVR